MATQDNSRINYVVNVDVKQAEADIKALEAEVGRLEKAFADSDKRTKVSRKHAEDLGKAQQQLRMKTQQLTNAQNQNSNSHLKTTASIEKEIRALVKLRSNLELGSAAYDKAGVDINRLSQMMNRSSGASGAATSSVMEFGRVVSDAPYGIRGMANNLSQLTSMMFYAAKEAGGMGKALKQMGKLLIGPIGIVLAITAAIAALDYFHGSSKKAAKDVDSLNGTFGEQSAKLLYLKAALNDTNLSIEDKNELIAKSNEEFEELNTKLDENGVLTTASQEAIDNLSLALVKNAKARAIVVLIQKEQSKILEAEAKGAAGHVGQLEAFGLAILQSVVGTATAVSKGVQIGVNNQKKIVDEGTKNIDKYIAMLSDKNAEMGKLIWDVDTNGGSGSKRDKAGASVKSNELDMQKQRQAAMRKELMDVTIHQEDKRRLKQEWARQDLLDQKDLWQEKETLRIKNFITKQRLRADNNKDDAFIQSDVDRLIKEARKTLFDQLIQSEEEYIETSKRLKQTQNTNNEQAALEAGNDYADALQYGREIDEEMAAWQTNHNITQRVDTYNADMLKLENIHAQTKLELDAKKEGSEEWNILYQQYKDEELDITVKTAKRKMDVEEAEAYVRNQLFDATKASFGAMSKLMKKNSAESKVFALLEIAAGTAQGMINGLKIAQEGSDGLGPASPAAFAVYFASQTAAVLGAAARAKSILNGGGTGGGTASSAASAPSFRPDFNVVGNSNENQLAEGIGGQLNTPTRAYVVYEDIEEAGSIQSESIESSGI